MILLSVLAMALQNATAIGASTPVASVGAPRVSPAINQLASQFDITSKATGRTYRIYVSRPQGTPPRGGWPVIYVLDGDITFATVATQNMLRAAYGDSGAVIVGVGYPDSMAGLVLRNRDLTPSAPTEIGRKLGLLGNAKPGDFGGSLAFREFMKAELKPAIAALFPVDASSQTLIGYSYGGLFALGVLFSDPGAYKTYVIGSPSIWWNDREILAAEPSFANLVRSGRAMPRILITSGELEQDPTKVKLPTDAAQRARTIEAVLKERMVDNARELAQRLKALPGKGSYRVEYVLLRGETHLSGLPAAMSRGYGFAMKP